MPDTFKDLKTSITENITRAVKYAKKVPKKVIKHYDPVEFKAYSPDNENIEFKINKYNILLNPTNDETYNQFKISCSNARKLKKILELHLSKPSSVDITNHSIKKRTNISIKILNIFTKIDLPKNTIIILQQTNIIDIDHINEPHLKPKIYIIDFINKNFYIKINDNDDNHIELRFTDILIDRDRDRDRDKDKKSRDCEYGELKKQPVSIRYGVDPKDVINTGSFINSNSKDKDKNTKVPNDCQHFITCSDADKLKKILIQILAIQNEHLTNDIVEPIQHGYQIIYKLLSMIYNITKSYLDIKIFIFDINYVFNTLYENFFKKIYINNTGVTIGYSLLFKTIELQKNITKEYLEELNYYLENSNHTMYIQLVNYENQRTIYDIFMIYLRNINIINTNIKIKNSGTNFFLSSINIKEKTFTMVNETPIHTGPYNFNQLCIVTDLSNPITSDEICYGPLQTYPH
jgi:hypothetical protein